MPMIVNQGMVRELAMMRALILGGTGEANRLAEQIAREGIDAIYSYAGRTQVPLGHSLPTRIGGFGGAEGLADFIRLERITHVIDATHPFAADMSRNAVTACAATQIPLIALERAPWCKIPGDKWIEVPDIAAAVAALPEARSRVFLAIGRQHLLPFGAKTQHAYTLRFVDPPEKAPPLPDAQIIISRGPFTLAGELELMRSRGIEWLVARNSGGTGARAKIDAARELDLPVVMIARPELPERPSVASVQEVLAWLGHDARLGA
jgi:precorrin-6A/cobalt-precorrin-6A reductase